MGTAVHDESGAIESALTITVAGRKFHAATDATFERDMYVMDLSERSGLDGLVAAFDPEKGALDEFSTKMVLQAWRSGALFALLGAMLDEVGVPWSIARAEANAALFSHLTRREDKEALRGSVVAVVVSFFVRGLLSNATLPSSLARANEMATQDETPSVMHGDESANGLEENDQQRQNDADSPTAAAGSSASGTTSSEPSRGTTSTDTTPS